MAPRLPGKAVKLSFSASPETPIRHGRTARPNFGNKNNHNEISAEKTFPFLLTSTCSKSRMNLRALVVVYEIVGGSPKTAVLLGCA